MNFRVSVVIPVYNAVRYIEKAVESAVHEPEAGEVILVDDGYQDGALEVCRKLADKYEKVKLFRHPGGENRGAGASRNLGIRKAGCEYIGFLDADDYFLPGRFKRTAEVFAGDPKVDAVYEPVGTEYENEQARREFSLSRELSWEDSAGYITYPLKPLYGKDFFYSLLKGGNGYPSTIGITVKKKILEKSGLFNENLRLHQDAELWVRIAWYGTFAPGGHREPVTNRLVHPENRITRQNYESMFRLHKAVYEWSETVPLDKKALRLVLRNYVNFRYWYRFNGNNLLVKIAWRLHYYMTIFLHPKYW